MLCVKLFSRATVPGQSIGSHHPAWPFWTGSGCSKFLVEPLPHLDFLPANLELGMLEMEPGTYLQARLQLR